nr:type II toxin-antitoxin system RelB/DinJ family antitoxin [Rhizobium sp. Khangiran2]
MAENWIRTDEAEDVAGSIRHAIRAAQFLGEDPLAWKWVVMALHSALQGACVCHLTTTAAPVGAVTERNAGEWLTYLEDSRTNPNAKPPKTHLMGLPELLKAVRKPNSAGDGSNIAGVAISEFELNWLHRFHKETRNQFAHFQPMGWSIEVSGIPEIAKLVARIIGDILGMGWAFRHQDCAQREELRRTLHALEAIEWPTS